MHNILHFLQLNVINGTGSALFINMPRLYIIQTERPSNWVLLLGVFYSMCLWLSFICLSVSEWFTLKSYVTE